MCHPSSVCMLVVKDMNNKALNFFLSVCEQTQSTHILIVWALLAETSMPDLDFKHQRETTCINTQPSTVPAPGLLLKSSGEGSTSVPRCGEL